MLLLTLFAAACLVPSHRTLGAEFRFHPKLSYYHHTEDDRNGVYASYEANDPDFWSADDFTYEGYAKRPKEPGMCIQIVGDNGIQPRIANVAKGDYLHIQATGTVNGSSYSAAGIFTSTNKIAEWFGRAHRFDQDAPLDPLPGKTLKVAGVPKSLSARTEGNPSPSNAHHPSYTAVSQAELSDFKIGSSNGPGVIVRVPNFDDYSNVFLFKSVDRTSFSSITSASAKLQITEVNATTGRPRLYIDPNLHYSEPEPGGPETVRSVAITISRQYATQFPTKVQCTVEYLNEADDGTDGDDFDDDAWTEYVDIPEGATTIATSEKIRIRKDGIYERDEYFKVTLSIDTNDNPNEAYVHANGTTSYTYLVRIEDGDDPPALEFSDPPHPTNSSGFASSDAVEPGPDEERLVPIPIRLSHPSKFPTRVWYAIHESGSTAEFDEDYRFDGPIPVTIPAGDKTGSIPVTLIGDGVFDGLKKLRIGLDAFAHEASYSQSWVPGGQHVLLISDYQGMPVITLAGPDGPIIEGNEGDDPTIIHLTATASHANVEDVTIHLDYGDSSATGYLSEPPPPPTSVPFVDALYIDGPLGRRVRKLEPDEIGLSQSQYSELAREFALSTIGWNLAPVSSSKGSFAPPEWSSSDGDPIFHLDVPESESDHWGYDTLPEYLVDGIRRLVFHTDSLVAPPDPLQIVLNNIGEPSPFGTISGVVAGIYEDPSGEQYSANAIGVAEWGTYGFTKIADPGTQTHTLYIDGPLGYRERPLESHEEGLTQDTYSALARDFALSMEGWDLAGITGPPLATYLGSGNGWPTNDGQDIAIFQVNPADAGIFALSPEWKHMVIFHTDANVSRANNDPGEPADFGIISDTALNPETTYWELQDRDWGTYGVIEPSGPADDPPTTGFDFVAPSSVVLRAGYTEVDIPIQILPDGHREVDETIKIRLNGVAPDGAADLADPMDGGKWDLTIIDDDQTEIEEIVMPDPATNPKPPAPGSATVTIAGGLPVATWRIRGEPFWRMSDDTATGLAVGTHVIEFREIKGYLTPAAVEIVVDADGYLRDEDLAALQGIEYENIDAPDPGRLRVKLVAPVEISPRWRLEGEPETAWREPYNPELPEDDPAQVPDLQLPAGYHDIVLESFPGYSAPLRAKVYIYSGDDESVVTINYTAKPAGWESIKTPQPVDSADLDTNPHVFCGQIETSAGFASGVAVRPRVVLTAAHVLFDDRTLTYATDVRWYHQRQRGEFAPPVDDPDTVEPWGWLLMSGYSAEQINIQASGSFVAPGVSTAASQKLDLGAMFFLKTPDKTVWAARGGKAGFLKSDDPGANQWLISTDPVIHKTLVGYPLSNVRWEDRGKLHATNPTTGALFPYHNHVYTSSDLISSGGMSGGGLFVSNSVGTEAPWKLAAVYLGEQSGESLFRSIDSEAEELILAAESASDDSTDDNGWVANPTTGTGATGRGSSHAPTEITVRINIPQGSWRQVGEDAWKRGGEKLTLASTETTAAIEFAAVSDFDAPAPIVVDADDQPEVSAAYKESGTYSSWATLYFGPDADPATTDPIASHHGLTNTAAYAFGLDPWNPVRVYAGDSSPGLPNITFDTSMQPPMVWIDSLERDPADAPGLTYHPEYAHSPGGPWQPATAVPIRIPLGNGWIRSILQFQPPAPDGRLFARVRVTLAP
jgi:hypothetical protein